MDPKNPLSAIRAAGARCWDCLDRPAPSALLAWLVPLAFGLVALALGQDANWDLMNYHRYGPYALLAGRIGFDLAPGQWQSYFNPALDLVYHGLNRVLPAPLAGFAMGTLHGLNFVLLLGLTRRLVAGRRAALLLALAGMLGAGFLSEVGNSMGDNLTALCVLGAMLVLVARWDRMGARSLLLAGLVAGVGTGLKLTNAVYALAMCLALLSLAGGVGRRALSAFVFGLGVLAGMAASAGFWYWKMWQVFGNPLFPQFNNIFKAPLAAPWGIGDTSWLPKGLLEKLLWPFIFTLHPARVIELPIRQLIWPFVYLLFLALLCRALLRRGPGAPSDGRQRFMLLFFALAYLVWLNLFGIYRYLVPLELMAPLVAWLLMQRLLPAAQAGRIAGVALLLVAMAVYPTHSWGHAGWARAGFRAELPALPAPEQNLVFIVHGDPPMSWLVPLFPRALAFVSLGSGFPESPAYLARMQAMLAQRGGPFYTILAYPHHPGADPALRDSDIQAVAQLRARAVATLERYGLAMDPASCRPYDAYIGQQLTMYQLCVVTRKPSGQ